MTKVIRGYQTIPFDTKEELDDDGNIISIVSYVKPDNSKIVRLYENCTMNDLEEAGFTYIKLSENNNPVWINLCE